MKKLKQPTELERHVMNINIKLMVYEEILYELLQNSGYSESEAFLKIENSIKETTQKLFESAEDVDPEGAAKLDQRKISEM